MSNSWPIKRLSILTLAGILLVSAWTAWPLQAAVPKLDNIRVALFAQLPAKNFNDTTAAATFSSAGGLQIGIRLPGSTNNWFSIPENAEARFAIDDYKVKLYESSKFASALAVYQRIQTAKGAGYITSLSKNGVITYQVTEGTYKTAVEATAGLNKWAKDTELSKLVGGFKPLIQGPLHLESAPFPSKAVAAEAANAFGNVGLDAFVAMRSLQKDTVSYSVMVGSAATDAELQIIKAVATKAPNGSGLKTADTGSAYLLISNDHSLSKAVNSTELYSFTGTDTKVTVSPITADFIKLTERSNRAYRGTFELSVLNGRMAVVNELPFEQYLYSVTGAEMISSWPEEALKAQAVAARTYALNKGFGFQIAHVVDTTLSQAYYGTGWERPSTIAAVDQTAGEVALYNGKVIETLFSSSSGGITADAKEIWNNSVSYFKPVSSPDQTSEAGLFSWYRVVLDNGEVGYVREDLVEDSGKTTAAGSRVLNVKVDGTKVRKHPFVQDSIPLIAELSRGATVIELEKTIESNQMNWVRGPFTSKEMLTTINARALTKLTSPPVTMEVSERGASGRATAILINGQLLDVKYPDAFRATLGVQGSLPSTLFQIEETAKVSMLGAEGATRTKSAGNQSIYTIAAGDKVSESTNENLFLLSADGQLRTATKEPSFRFIGRGNGHGLGMSQYGALGLAQQGYDYQYILKYYYKDVTIAKE